jgi:hypothetical protein
MISGLPWKDAPNIHFTEQFIQSFWRPSDRNITAHPGFGTMSVRSIWAENVTCSQHRGFWRTETITLLFNFYANFIGRLFSSHDLFRDSLKIVMLLRHTWSLNICALNIFNPFTQKCWNRSLLLLVATRIKFTTEISLQDPWRYFHLESHNSPALNALFHLEHFVLFSPAVTLIYVTLFMQPAFFVDQLRLL